MGRIWMRRTKIKEEDGEGKEKGEEEKRMR